LVHVNAFVRNHVDMQTVPLVEFKNPEAAGFRPSAPDQGQEVIPTLSGIHQVEDFRECERPHVKPPLSSEPIAG
jgi:hypothetical protein